MSPAPPGRPPFAGSAVILAAIALAAGAAVVLSDPGRAHADKGAKPDAADKGVRPDAPAALDVTKLRLIRPVPGQPARAPRGRARPNLSASLPPVLTPEEHKLLLARAAQAAGAAAPAETLKMVTLSLGHLLDDATDDELVLMSAAIAWRKVDAIVFADSTQWPRLVLHPAGPGKTLFVDCAVTGAARFDVSIVEVAPGTREINHDERGPARAAASQTIDTQAGHLYVVYQASAAATAKVMAHVDLVDHAGGPWALFHCEIARLD